MSSANSDVITIARPAISRPLLVAGLAIVALAVSMIFILSQGSLFSSLSELPSALFGDSETSNEAFVVQDLRLPRALMGLLVGAALGIAGTIMQAITRNPLGDPSLTGVTSGAAASVVFAFLFLKVAVGALVIWGIAGGLIGAAITFMLARQTNYSPVHITLAGVAVSMFFLALINGLILIHGQSLNGSYFWLIGNLAARTWRDVELVWPLVLIGLVVSSIIAGHLNILMLDEDNARARGLDVTRWRLFFGLITVMMTAVCVATCGPISFLGLVAPHVTRLSLGRHELAMDHRLLIPLSALVGASLMSLTDALAVSRILGSEVPTGLLSILIGGFFFLGLFKKRVTI